MSKKQNFRGHKGIGLSEEEQNEKHKISISKIELAELLCSAAAAQANIGKKLMGEWMYHQTKKYLTAANAIVSKYKVYDTPPPLTVGHTAKEVAKAVEHLASLPGYKESPVKELDKIIESTKVPDSTVNIDTTPIKSTTGIKIKININKGKITNE